jgi:hypothetical protein
MTINEFVLKSINSLIETQNKVSDFGKVIALIYEDIYANNTLPDTYKLNYPEIKFNITKEDILVIEKAYNLLFKEMITSKKGEKTKRKINSSLSILDKNSNEEGLVLKTPLEKIFFAILWKNAQLSRMRSIIAGLKSNIDIESHAIDEENNTKDADPPVVFMQFGKYLKDKNEPIIDQHVFRFYTLLRSTQKKFKDIDGLKNVMNEVKIKKGYKRKGELKEKVYTLKNIGENGALKLTSENLEIYTTFVLQLNLNQELKYKLDCVFFSLGKFIKSM